MSSVHTFSSRDFTRDVGAAKRAAAEGPVFITDRGRPAFALLRIEDYYKITGEQWCSLLALMDSPPVTAGTEFEPVRAGIDLKPTEYD